ncbi:MAG: integral rane protein [Conexibacter sp.]|nr:integral rane protein [Conexibacter sp.]
MDFLDALLILFAGLWAGAINTMVGSGTLVTFPVLLGLGYAPIVANMSNNVGLVPGSISGTLGYRAELRGQGPRAIRLVIAAALGGTAGATLLLTLPPDAFKAIVPVFIGIALVLVVLQPRLAKAIAARRAEVHPHGGRGVQVAVALCGVYGGYFGAAQGILLLAVLGLGLDDTLQRVNAIKNLLTLVVNGVAAIAFIALGDIAWDVAALIAVGSVMGGQIGSRVGRRLPDSALRGLIVVVGCFAIVKLLVT